MRTPIHPGEILSDELAELGLSANAFAKAINVPTNRVTQILSGKRGITIDTALRFGKFFETTADYWLNLQKIYDIDVFKQTTSSNFLEHIPTFRQFYISSNPHYDIT